MSRDRDNVRLLRSLGPGETSELAAAVEALKRNRDLIIAHHRELAAIQRQAYLAYVREGFTTTQAMDLVKLIR